MTVRRIHPYANGDDVAASRVFYVEVLGLQVAMEDPVLGWCRLTTRRRKCSSRHAGGKLHSQTSASTSVSRLQSMLPMRRPSIVGIASSIRSPTKRGVFDGSSSKTQAAPSSTCSRTTCEPARMVTRASRLPMALRTEGRGAIGSPTVKPMSVTARYAHTNLIARDWRRLARFYTEVFGCQPVGPQRDQAGERLEAGVADAHLYGQHLLLPGHGSSGPTLEIYTYQDTLDQAVPAANRAGYGHLAFEVADVAVALQEMLAHGGEQLGTVVGTSVPGDGDLQVTYARDPEGNIIELQSWTREDKPTDHRCHREK